MSTNPKDTETQKQQTLACAFTQLQADQKEIEAQAADIRESLFIHAWLDDETLLTEKRQDGK